MKILIIEDEEMLAKTMSKKLVREGFDVLVALDGLQGLRMALSEHPDIILLDLILPKLDGLSMLRKLREDSWGSHVKVIILSNLSDPMAITKGVDIGLNDVSLYLVKTDWSLDDVVTKIRERLV